MTIQTNNYLTARDILDENDMIYNALDSPQFADHSLSSAESHFQNQTAMVHHLYNCSVASVSQQDIHGNTALHYLASYRVVNYPLMTWLRSQDQGQYAWDVLRNRYGFTAHDLLSSNEAAVENPEGHSFWYSSNLRYKRNREQEKQLRASVEERRWAILQRRL